MFLPVRIEPMTPSDIPEVIAVERASYSMTWPQKAYDYELQQNELAHYYVLRFSNPQTNTSPTLSSKHEKISTSDPPTTIIGLGGFWLIADQIHINTIAVHPTWRGLGLGEWLLITLLEAGQSLGAETATLEVRPSNHAAISLYRKYVFHQVGRRLRYYSDNGEDALIFTTPPLALPDYQAMLQQRKTTLFQQLAQIDRQID